jgi:coenzyme PQQ synthesis protein D (PqqD)
VGEDVVLVDLQTNQVYALNPTGSRVWELLGEHQDREHMLAELRTEFDVDEPQLTREVDELLDDLVGAGLLLRDV